MPLVFQDEDKDAVKVSDLKTTVPPGIWRKGKDCPKSDSIFLRFATFADKKVMNNIKNNDYINKFGKNFSPSLCQLLLSIPLTCWLSYHINPQQCHLNDS